MRLKTFIFPALAAMIIISAIWVWRNKRESGGIVGNAGNYYSVQERRLPCGRILRREVVNSDDAWVKRVSLLDPSGRVLDSKTRTIEPEHCEAIQVGRFVPSLWADCSVAI